MTIYHRPGNLDEALALRQRHPEYTILAGGTDLLVAHNQQPVPLGLIDVFAVEGLRGIAVHGDTTVRIGAATTYREILESAECAKELPILVAAAKEVGALQIQARGTIGGNIQTSSPVGDTLPVLLALDAEIEVASTGGRRTIPYRDFVTAYRATALAEEELIIAVNFPPRPQGLVQDWRKVGTRRAQSISKVMFAGAAVVKGGVIGHLRLALGAVADRPIRIDKAEAAATQQPASAATAEAVRNAVATAINPIDDVRSTADYRRSVAANLAARFILSLAG